MKSPIYPQLNLIKSELEPGLTAWKCPKSGGHWISASSYKRWQKTTTKSATDEVSYEYKLIEASPEDQIAKICPESGCLLSRYRISQDLNIYLDRSPLTGGIWFDKGEWEILKQRKLHTKLDKLSSDYWQKSLREQEHKEALFDQLKEKLGTEGFEKTLEFKEWIRIHPRRSDILAFLQNNDL